MSPSFEKTKQMQKKAQKLKETKRDKLTMKARDGKGVPPADLLVCFPSRAHLARPICSPARPTDLTKRHHHHHHHHHQLRSGQASPLLWAKTKAMGREIAEPTSPKVSCAGQIKARPKTKPKPSSSKNWQSVMEEIERLHNNRKHNKRPTWVDTHGFKKDMMQFLTSLRSHRFNFQCFGYFHGSDVNSVGEDVEVDQENQVGLVDVDVDGDGDGSSSSSAASRAIFSKWFMVLQENKINGLSTKEASQYDQVERQVRDGSCDEGCVPPSNALLLMRCRSAPSKNWFDEKQKQQEQEKEKEEEEEEEKKAKLVLEEEKKSENLILKCYAPDFFKVSSTDIANEAWVVAGMKDPLSRSRSWKR